jgi:glutaredoxin
MRVRFFGSPDCKDCMIIFVLLNKFQIDYEYIDVTDDDDEIQDFCDHEGIDELPHLQFMIDNDIILQHVGLLKEEDLIGYLADYFPDY